MAISYIPSAIPANARITGHNIHPIPSTAHVETDSGSSFTLFFMAVISVSTQDFASVPVLSLHVFAIAVQSSSVMSVFVFLYPSIY